MQPRILPLRGRLLEGRAALDAHIAGAPASAYVILLDDTGGKVESIRGFLLLTFALVDCW